MGGDVVLGARGHPAVAAAAALRRPAGRLAAAACLAEGPHLVAEALAAGLRPLAVFVTAAFAAGPQAALVADLRRRLPPGAAEASPLPAGLFVASRRVFAALSAEPAPQGLLAVFALPPCGPPGGEATTLILDGVQDPGNVGALARSLLAFGGAGALLLTGPGTADPYGEKALRASAGAMFRLRHRQAESLPAAIAGLPQRPWALCPRGGEDLRRARLVPPLALVVGSEGAGVSPAVAELCRPLSIVLAGPAESLNAAAAGAIALYAARTWGAQGAAPA